MLSHMNPDGDTLGSMCALYSMIYHRFKKKADMNVVSNIPYNYKFLPNIDLAQRYYDKMMAALTKDKKEYYKLEIKCYLKPHEDPEKIPQMLEEFHEAYKVRKAHIAKLYDEVKQIKRLSI